MDKSSCWIKNILRLIAFILILLPCFSVIALSAEAPRFKNNGDGTISDNKTGLMWAASDNGTDIDFDNAEIYCNSFSAGGFSNWRLPDIEELKVLFDEEARKTKAFGITEKISLSSCCPWSSYDSTGVSSMIDFRTGKEIWGYKGDKELLRALPVRQRKQ